MAELTLQLKNLKGEMKNISALSTDVIESKLDEIRGAFGYNEFEVNIIFSGRVLDVEKTFEHYNIVNDSLIVVMSKGKKKKQAHSAEASTVSTNIPAPVSAPPPTPAPTPAMSHAVSPLISNISELPPQSSSNVPTTEPPIGSLSHFWAHAPAEDQTPLFSVEQVHATTSILFPLIIQSTLFQNPAMTMMLLQNPNSLTTIISGPEFRSTIRQILSQSDGVVNALRSGTAASVRLGGPVSTTSATATTPSDETVLSESEDSDNDNEVNDESATGETITIDQPSQSFVAPEVQQTVTLQQTTEEHDTEIINQLASLTGVTVAMAREAYMACGKNADLAANLIFQRFED